MCPIHFDGFMRGVSQEVVEQGLQGGVQVLWTLRFRQAPDAVVVPAPPVVQVLYMALHVSQQHAMVGALQLGAIHC